MDELLVELRGIAEPLLAQLSSRWTLIQIGLVLAAVLLSYAASFLVEPRFEARLRAIRRMPGLLRLLAAALRRTHWILAAGILWGIYLVLREITWPSRSYLVFIGASLVTSWVAIAVLARVIRNRTLSRIVTLLAWLAAAIAILGLRAPVSEALDAMAIRVGSFRLSALGLLHALALLAALTWVGHVIGEALERSLKASTDFTPSLKVLISKLAKIALFTAAVLITVSAAGIDLTTLTLLSGAVGLGLGFGLQKVVSNFVSGVIILVDRSVKPGDVIQLGETFGWIDELRARFVSVVTRDGRKYLIPNEDFVTQRVINWSYNTELVRLDVYFRASYDADPHVIRRLAVEAALGVPRVKQTPIPVCHIVEFGASAFQFILRFWISDPANGITNVRGAVLLACWDTFQANGIKIPYPQQEVIVRQGGDAPEVARD